jgi:hypothetical protein
MGNDMIQGRYTRIDFREIHKERKVRTVKLGSGRGNTKMKFTKVVVQIKAAGEALDGKQKGKTVYETFQSIDVEETTTEEVFGVIRRALENASKK